MKIKSFLGILSIVIICNTSVAAQTKDITLEAKNTMLRATTYMVENVSTNGGYVWYYLPDFSRRWGELEAYKTQVWLQGSGGTIDMGNAFLDAYNATENEYYYNAAEKVAEALIWGQLPCGGWNYFIDFAGNSSLEEWYNTIGKNAWGFEEFNHYYGNATFDDGVSAAAASFLLRMYVQKLDVKFKPFVEKAIEFMNKSQYPLGGWPQRYPLMYEFPHGYSDDYTSFYTFNDGVIQNNIGFLIKCYVLLGRKDLLKHIMRGMNFYLITQQGNPQGGWGQQYNMNLEPAHARTYEPPALLPSYTYDNAWLLLQFYRYTGDRKFLARIPDAIKWLENTQLPEDETAGGKYTNPVFVEVGTNKAIYTHRSGTDVTNGHYWWDYNDENPVLHYGEKAKLDIEKLKEAYKNVSELSVKEAMKDSPLKEGAFVGDETPQVYYRLHPYFPDIMDLQLISNQSPAVGNKVEVLNVINSLDDHNSWRVKHVQISRPYAVSAKGKATNTAKLSNKEGASIVDSSDQQYISTRQYIKNMEILINYINKTKS
jgi:PelA/Pel-15E family pectate lyase